MNGFPWEVAFGLALVMAGTLYWVLSILQEANAEMQIKEEEAND